jgi:hypothetical protein
MSNNGSGGGFPGNNGTGGREFFLFLLHGNRINRQEHPAGQAEFKVA